MVIHTLCRSELRGFVFPLRATGFSWDNLLVLRPCDCDGSCGHRVEKTSVDGMWNTRIFVSFFFIFLFGVDFELNFVFSEEPRGGGGSNVPG